LTTSAHTNDNHLLTVIGLHDRAQSPNSVIQPIQINYTFNGIQGLVGAWGFNQSSCLNASPLPALLTIDTSNFGNNGFLSSVHSGPASVQGHIGRALDFDGLNDHVKIDGSSTLENVTDTSHTFSAWVYPDSVPPAQTDNDASYTILARDYSGLYYDASRKFRAEIKPENGPTVSLQSGNFNPNVWHQVVMTVNDAQKELHLFIDGQEVANSPVSYSGSLADLGDGPYFIGTSEPLTNRYEYRFNGRIDEVQIFNRALSAGQVNTLFAWKPNNPVTYAYCSYQPAVNRN
jgi:hypothetical protein